MLKTCIDSRSYEKSAFFGLNHNAQDIIKVRQDNVEENCFILILP